MNLSQGKHGYFVPLTLMPVPCSRTPHTTGTWNRNSFKGLRRAAGIFDIINAAEKER
jgi:hypothetical protein